MLAVVGVVMTIERHLHLVEQEELVVVETDQAVDLLFRGLLELLTLVEAAVEEVMAHQAEAQAAQAAQAS